MKRSFQLLALGSALSLLLLGCSAHITIDGLEINSGGCNYTAAHSQEVAAGDAKRLQVYARSGALTIRGNEGITEVQVEGRACASSEQLLAQMGLDANRSGDAIQVEVLFPNQIINGSAWMDLTINVPAGMSARVDASSGSVLIEELAGLELNKASGDLDVRRIRGDVQVKASSGTFDLADIDGATSFEAGSGEATLRNLKGKVTIPHKSSGRIVAQDLGSDLIVNRVGSGDLSIQGVGGKVVVDEKSSGRVEISRVKGDVTLHSVGSGDLDLTEIDGAVEIGSKSSGAFRIKQVGESVRVDDVGSGTLDVRDVKGDLTVRAKSSGQISHSGVKGRVEVPQR